METCTGPTHLQKGRRGEAANYRPISLTSICCKLLEHIVMSEITSHLNFNNIITDAQHGFRKKPSCETQLILKVDDLAGQVKSMKVVRRTGSFWNCLKPSTEYHIRDSFSNLNHTVSQATPTNGYRTSSLTEFNKWLLKVNTRTLAQSHLEFLELCLWSHIICNLHQRSW